MFCWFYDYYCWCCCCRCRGCRCGGGCCCCCCCCCRGCGCCCCCCCCWCCCLLLLWLLWLRLLALSCGSNTFSDTLNNPCFSMKLGILGLIHVPVDASASSTPKSPSRDFAAENPKFERCQTRAASSVACWFKRWFCVLPNVWVRIPRIYVIRKVHKQVRKKLLE